MERKGGLGKSVWVSPTLFPGRVNLTNDHACSVFMIFFSFYFEDASLNYQVHSTNASCFNFSDTKISSDFNFTPCDFLEGKILLPEDGISYGPSPCPGSHVSYFIAATERAVPF